MEFKKITKDSYKELKPYLERQEYKMCDYSFGILYIWKDYFNYKYAIDDDVLYLKGKADIDGFPSFFLPIGQKTLKEKVECISKHCEFRGYEMSFGLIPEDAVAELENIMNIKATPEDIWNDYLYDASLMATYTGKAYGKKRNHYNGFIKSYSNYKLEIIDKNNINEVKQFYEIYKENCHKDADLFHDEEIELTKLLNDYFTLPFIGACLKVDNQIMAFTIGEIISDVLYVHVEKADIEYNGAYATIQKLFAKNCLDNYNIKYINREDDAGDAGLKQSKLSYNPIQIIKKYKIGERVSNSINKY